MHTITHSILLLLALAITAHAQSIDPKDILRSADSACRLVRTATYWAEAFSGPKGSPKWTRTGNVTFQRLDQKDDVGAKVRIELDNGVVYLYDGTSLRLLQPENHKILVVGPEVPGSSFITGNVVGQLLQSAFTQDSLHAGVLKSATEVEYRGTQRVGDVECHVVTTRFADGEIDSNITQEMYFGVEDYLPRKHSFQYTLAGKVQQQQLEIRNLTVNISLSESAFLLPPPEGFQVEQFQKPGQVELLAAGTVAPDWTIADATGRPVQLAALKGKIVMLDFWYTTCGPCLRAMPKIQKIHERFADRGVIVYGVNPWPHDTADAVRLMQKRGYTYGLLLNAKDVATAYHVTVYPTFYIIGDDGKVLFREVGYSEGREEEIAGVIEKYLHERGR